MKTWIWAALAAGLLLIALDQAGPRRTRRAVTSAAGATVRFVDPQATDPAIDAWLEPHAVAFNPAVAPRRRLFLYFVGSFGRPDSTQRILAQAADQGFHVISLRYPNSWTVHSLCGQQDAACFGAVRSEIFDGVDRSSLISVSAPNSIQRRLRALLAHLDGAYPAEGWGDFLADPPVSGADAVRWDRVRVGGHSQGGGMAALIAQQHAVERVCMFAAPADRLDSGALAGWLLEPHATPSAAYYGLIHEQDGLYPTVQAIWPALGMDAFGPFVRVDQAAPSFDGSHQLTTTAAPAEAGEYHGSVVVDRNTPLGAGGEPLLAPVWHHLCFAEQAAAIYLPLLAREPGGAN